MIEPLASVVAKFESMSCGEHPIQHMGRVWARHTNPDRSHLVAQICVIVSIGESSEGASARTRRDPAGHGSTGCCKTPIEL